MSNEIKQKISIVKPVKSPKPKNGDILGGSEFIAELLNGKQVEEMLCHHLSIVRSNHWKALDEMGIEYQDLMSQSEYDCPFRPGICFYRIYPICISRLLPSEPKNNVYVKHIMQEYGDTDFGLYKPQTDNIDSVFMGHGYSEGISPDDGSGRWEWGKINLSDGRFLLVKYWEWYNK